MLLVMFVRESAHSVAETVLVGREEIGAPRARPGAGRGGIGGRRLCPRRGRPRRRYGIAALRRVR